MRSLEDQDYPEVSRGPGLDEVSRGLGLDEVSRGAGLDEDQD